MRPVIAVDIDGVLLDTQRLIADYLNNLYDTTVNSYDMRIPDAFDEFVRLTNKPKMSVMADVQTLMLDEEFQQARPLLGSVEALRALYQHFDIMVITARSPEFQPSTNAWLDRHFPEIISEKYYPNTFSMTQRLVEFVDKSKYLIEGGARWLIDDSVHNFEPLQHTSIQGLLFGMYPWNKAGKFGPNVQRVLNWNEVMQVILNDKALNGTN